MSSAWSAAFCWPCSLAGLRAAGVVCGVVSSAAVVALQAWQLIRFERWLRLRNVQNPPNMRGLWGEAVATAHRLHRRKNFHKRRVTDVAARIPAHDHGDARWRDPAGTDRQILWFNRMAGKWLDLRRKVDYGIRIDNLLRHPEFIEYVEKRRGWPAPRIHLPKHGDRWLACNLVTTNSWGLQLLILRDVTNEARLENMRRDFVANASHELRSPLTVISGYLDTLGDDPGLDDGWREPVREMQRQSARMGHHRAGPARAVAPRSQQLAMQSRRRSTWPACSR